MQQESSRCKNWQSQWPYAYSSGWRCSILAEDGTFWKGRINLNARATGRRSQPFGRSLSEQKSWCNWSGQYYEHCRRSTVPREWGRSTLFLCKQEGPKIIICESLSERENASWLEETSTTHDWVVCTHQNDLDDICSFELSGQEVYSNINETNSQEQDGEKWKICTLRAERHSMLQIMEEQAGQYQNGSERGSLCSVLYL